MTPRTEQRIARRELLAGVLAAAAAPGVRTKAIRVGCQTRLYGVPIRERAKLLFVLDDLATLGYEGFETNFSSLEPSFEQPAPLRAEFEKRRVGLIGLHMSAKFDPATLEKDRAQIERVATATRAFGGTHLMLSGAGVPRDVRGAIDHAALERRCAELDRAGKRCREIGIRLCSHNHAKELENNAEELRAVLAATDPKNVSMLLDIAYVHMAGLRPAALIREIGPRCAGLHVRDMKGAKEAVMGTGEIDYQGLAEALRASRWSGWVILEMNQRPDFTSRELAEIGRKYMREVMNM